MRAYTLTLDACTPCTTLAQADAPQLVFRSRPGIVATTITVDPVMLDAEGRLHAASVVETGQGEMVLGTEQPHDDGWLLVIDADAATFGFVDLVVRQGELWGALTP